MANNDSEISSDGINQNFSEIVNFTLPKGTEHGHTINKRGYYQTFSASQ